jgi:N-acetylmuramoyl-L-alanine amidase CwlA
LKVSCNNKADRHGGFYRPYKEIYQHIPDNETAWHCGDGKGSGNTKSIGIEICMNSDGDILEATDNAVELVVYLCKAHNIPLSNVVQHNYWSGKNCPQMLRSKNPYNWDTFIAKVKQGLDVKTELTSINDIVWELASRGIISDKDLWLDKLEKDSNSYWLARKMVEYLQNKNL